MSKHKILVVEDDDSLRDAICTFLDFSDLGCIGVSNGTDAINILRTDSVDLVLCDINLPDILGTEILQFVRADKHLYKLPFIFLSAFADKADISKGMNLGADDYITKPFRQKDLVEAILAKLEKSRRYEDLFTNEMNTRVLTAINNNLTHEIITPLNGIIQGAYLINSLPDTIKIADMKDAFMSIYHASMRMKRDVDNIIISSSLSTNNFTALEDEDFSGSINLHSELNDIIKTYHLFALPVNIEADINEVHKWKGALKYIRIIFTELIDNAVKFSGNKTNVQVLLSQSNDGFVFSIKNKVDGSPEFQLSDVGAYKKFHNNSSQNGLGLGLYVTSALCKSMGLALAMKSTDRDITFIISSA